MIRALVASALVAAIAAPAAAQLRPTLPDDDGVAGAPAQLRAAERLVPAQLTPAQRFAYRRLFLDIDGGRLSAAQAALDAMTPGPLHGTAQAQILLGQGASAGLSRLTAWLQSNPRAPQAAAIGALARRAGATELPAVEARRALTPVSFVPALGPRSARLTTPEDAQLAAAAKAAIAADRALDVEAMLDAPNLSADVRAEWAQRAAWDRYIDGDDEGAIRLADRTGGGAVALGGEQGAWAQWVGGLAAFRRGDCDGAAQRFDRARAAYVDADFASAAAYWAARAHTRCGRPLEAAQRLQTAYQTDATGFYGLLAARALGLQPRIDWGRRDFINADWNALVREPGARRAAALVEIGQTALADRELRFLAATASDSLYEPLLNLSGRLNLPATQYWLARNAPAGRKPSIGARLPEPAWRPFNGWRVDRFLVFAHAMQESAFVTTARSGAGARGLLQLMPGTARDMARAASMTHDEALLADPSFNVEYGQAFLESLRDSRHTQGLLPKVIAAYNAGPGSVQKWNTSLRDNGDVLLFIESIPFRETRHYVEVVMRNLWLYQLRAGAPVASLDAVAANRWPRFPGLPGEASVETPPFVAPRPAAPPLAPTIAVSYAAPAGPTQAR